MAYNRGERPDCAKHQRALTVAIKRARHMAMMPYIQD